MGKQLFNESPLKLRIRAEMPVVFKLLKAINRPRLLLHATIDSQRIKFRDKKLAQISSILINEYSREIRNGIFKGLELPDLAHHSWHPSILLGSYEKELYSTLQSLQNQNYTRQIHIGSGYGYFAVGMAKLLPDSQVMAYDINKESIEISREFAKLNEVKNISFHGECRIEDLAKANHSKTLIFCDCEGAEKEILDPTKVPQLAKSDIVVETHDHIVPGVTEQLENWFCATHKIQRVTSSPRDPKEYTELKTFSKSEQALAMDELRHGGAGAWLWLRSKKE